MDIPYNFYMIMKNKNENELQLTPEKTYIINEQLLNFASASHLNTCFEADDSCSQQYGTEKKEIKIIARKTFGKGEN